MSIRNCSIVWWPRLKTDERGQSADGGVASPVLHRSSSEPGVGFAWRLALFYAALFVALGVQLPFLPVWLAAKGLDADMIGIVLAIPMIVRVFAIPLATRRADRHDALRMAIVIAAAGAVVGYGVVGFAQGAAAIAMAFVFASVFYTPIMPLADAYALRGLGRLGRAYGPVRMWGSAAFIVGSFGAGVLLDVTAARNLIWLIVAAAVITAAAACVLKPLGPQLGSAPQAGSSSVWRDPAFLAVAAAASLIQASHAVFYGFSALDWRAAGLDGAAIAALWALGVAAEIVLFAISGRLPIAPTTLLFAMAFDPPAILLPPLQCLHALSFGASHLGALGFIARTTPPKLGATAQGYLAVALGLAMAASMALAGVLYTRWGGLAYGAMALLAAAGGVCALAARRLASRGV